MTPTDPALIAELTKRGREFQTYYPGTKLAEFLRTACDALDTLSAALGSASQAQRVVDPYEREAIRREAVEECADVAAAAHASHQEYAGRVAFDEADEHRARADTAAAIEQAIRALAPHRATDTQEGE